MIVRNLFPILPVLAGLAACGGEPARDDAAENRPSDTADPGMPMAEMQMPSMDMMPEMRAHLDSLRVARPETLPGMVAGHRERATAMLKAMEADMRAMHMAGDAAWNALTDSVRTDLEALTSLEGESLVLRMRGYMGRMRRLLERHASMMGMTKM